MALYGGIEAGGTKFVCIVGSSPQEILAETRFPTTSPNETLQKASDFFKKQVSQFSTPLSSIGIGAFGPIDLDKKSSTYGYITTTPKPNWANTSVVKYFENEMQAPIGFDTDVNAAALGEWTWGAARGINDFIYLTIGTGIGGGAIVNGQPLHGLVHPEMGHMLLHRDPKLDPFSGYCPFHGECFEGLASGPSIKARWGQPAETLPAEHPAWDLEAEYIAQALEAYICILSPQKIILGGGVMEQTQLFPLIRQKVISKLNGYVKSPAILDTIGEYITSPGLGGRAGVLGALALAKLVASK